MSSNSKSSKTLAAQATEEIDGHLEWAQYMSLSLAMITYYQGKHELNWIVGGNDQHNDPES